MPKRKPESADQRSLQEELKRERELRLAAESELHRLRGSAEERLIALAELLLEGLSNHEVKFTNPNVDGDDKPGDSARCWLHDPNCHRLPDTDNIGIRMQTCSDCEVFRRIAPDSFSQVGELINTILHLLRQKQALYVESQQQLVQSEKLAGLGELAAGLAHEINNPTGIILSRLDCMELEEAEQLPDTVREDLDVIRRHADRLRRITKSLTSFARRHKVEKKVVVCQDLLCELLEITERTITRSNVEIATSLPDAPMVAFADATMLQQVFMNIILNARDAMPDGGVLKIRGLNKGESLVFEFEDNGTGMDKVVQSKAFDPFFTTKETRGTGLGLSVSYGIIKDHGGNIEVESEPGVGSTFRVTIPAYNSMIDEREHGN